MLLKKDLEEALQEEIAKDAALARDEDERINLCFRRSYTVLASIVLVVGCWIAIAYVCYYEGEFQVMFSQYN